MTIATDQSGSTQALEEAEKCLYNGYMPTQETVVWYFNRLKCAFQRTAPTTGTNVSARWVGDGSVKINEPSAQARDTATAEESTAAPILP